MDTIPLGLRERKKVQTRKDLARAAINLFAKRGYGATTVDDIATAANVSRRTFFRYFKSKDEVFIVDPEGKLAALHVALAEGPPGEQTLDGLRRAMLAITEIYWDPELSRAIVALVAREPEVAAAARVYQARFAERLEHELALDMETDARLDPRPRILAHAAVALARSAVAGWLLEVEGEDGTPVDRAVVAFDRARPMLEAILALPVATPPMPTEAPVRTA